MSVRYMRAVALSVAMMATPMALTACGGSDNGGSSSNSTSSSGGTKSGTVALLLPENKTTRYEAQDKPLFEKDMKQLCPDCKVIYSNAEQDAAKQQTQAEAAITNGAKVLVLDSVDSKAAASIVTRAKQSGIGVVAYDRPVENADVDYFISFDNKKVGQLQATALVDKLNKDKTPGSLVMINGAPTDPNAAQFKAGAHSVLDGSSYKIAKEYDTPDWSPDKAQTEMDQAISALGKSGFVGVYAANDGTAGGAIAAMTSGGINPNSRPTTGQDAELAGVQRIVAGQQYMTVYKTVKQEAMQAAQLTMAVLNGDTSSSLVNQQINNGKKDVPSVILKPVAVTKSNIADTVVKDDYWTIQQICTPTYQAACKKIGLTG
ncbi:MAG TPA: sugar ABC transporter substrate-binding protein [Conexibacter sp.]|nr:sugar ABC transporter substrate-binding protein [Conexibacter sp.]